MSATGFLDLQHCAAHAIDYRLHIYRHFVTAPGDVTVGTYQNEMAAIALQHFRLVKGHDLKRQLPFRGRPHERRGVRRIGSKPEQDETTSEQSRVERPSSSQTCGAREPGRAVGT